MPSSFCVPDYSKKGYQDEDGSKVSFYQFPEEVKWMHAIRRDEGEHFHITKGTKVCLRHFRQYQYREIQTSSLSTPFFWTLTSVL